MLADAANVLVQVSGGPGMTLSEVEILMQELGRHVRDHTQILFGTAVDGRMGNRLSVTIMSSIVTDDAPTQTSAKTHVAPFPEPAPFVPSTPPIWEQQSEPVESIEAVDSDPHRNRRKL